MRTFHEGQLITLVDEDEALEGIVVHTQSLVRIEVAVPDTGDGPVFRMVHPKLLRERGEPGEHDDALRRLIRRTGSGGRGGPRDRTRIGAPWSLAPVGASHDRQVTHRNFVTARTRSRSRPATGSAPRRSSGRRRRRRCPDRPP